jgi:hypothetical protein
MVHDGTDATGMEDWRCPACGRHFMMRWPPHYERLVLAVGNENVAHVGTKGGIGFPEASITQLFSELGDAEAWRHWMREKGIDWD